MQDFLEKLTQQIRPRNGLVINADLWEEAHTYHDLHQRAHLLFGHGFGIITGLEVNESPSEEIWISPGMALDPAGLFIVLAEQVSLTIDKTQTGLIYIYLLANRTDESHSQRQSASQATPDRIQVGYSLRSGSTLPSDAVELARLRRSKPEAAISNPGNKIQPGFNELDQRFRQILAGRANLQVGMAIAYLGTSESTGGAKFGAKAPELAKALSHVSRYEVHIDDDISIEAGLGAYTLVYLIEGEQSKVSIEIQEALQAYLQLGGTLFVESYAPQSPLRSFLSQLGYDLAESLPDPILANPFLFSTPPPGFSGTGDVWVHNGVIFTTHSYGPLWQRQPINDDPLQSRAALRAATELGANIVTYAVEQKRNKNDR